MLKLVILLSVVACTFGSAIPEGLLPQLDGRVIGGTATTISRFPYQVSLQRNGAHFCGGSIYSATIIVTAAHCLQGVSASSLQIRAGSSYWMSGGDVLKVTAFRIHERFDASTMQNDIAVIRLSSSLSMSSNIKAIQLSDREPADYANARISGWGIQSTDSCSIPDQLQFADVQIIGRYFCGSGRYSYGIQIKDTMICASAPGKDSCLGDSGGPLVSNYRLVGVASWGHGCASPNYPGVYANVRIFSSWVTNAANSV